MPQRDIRRTAALTGLSSAPPTMDASDTQTCLQNPTGYSRETHGNTSLGEPPLETELIAATRPTLGQAITAATPKALLQVRLDLHWRSATAAHIDCVVATKLSLWRDLLPAPFSEGLLGQPIGCRLQHQFGPGELVASRSERQRRSLHPRQFDQRFAGQGLLQPRAGRFYPRGVLSGIPKVYSADRRPFRVLSCDESRLDADFNHPLADQPLELRLTLLGARDQDTHRSGNCHDVAELVTSKGPGMQARCCGRATDFWSDAPFMRADPGPDLEFYRQPRLISHVDRSACREISALYDSLLPRGGQILDLMAGWQSHLPATSDERDVIGIGMNPIELDANPQLTKRILQDINHDVELPLETASLDGAVCSFSIEYLTRPFEVFAELARVLKPGAPLVVAFSNRWFPPKVIRIWEAIHEFERLGLVQEFFLAEDRFRDIATFSLRGLPRPPEDRFADQLAWSDPVFAVWGSRS